MLEEIRINQSEIFRTGLNTETDLIDWVIINYLFEIERSTKGVLIEDKCYHALKLRTLLHHMPLIRINSCGGLSKRLTKLEKSRLIKLHKDEQNNLYFKVGYRARSIMSQQSFSVSGIA